MPDPGRCAGLMDHRFRYATLQKLGELLGNYRAAGKVSLSLAASFLLQKVQLFFGLHALGHHAMLEALSNVNQGARDRGMSEFMRSW